MATQMKMAGPTRCAFIRVKVQTVVNTSYIYIIYIYIHWLLIEVSVYIQDQSFALVGLKEQAVIATRQIYDSPLTHFSAFFPKIPTKDVNNIKKTHHLSMSMY